MVKRENWIENAKTCPGLDRIKELIKLINHIKILFEGKHSGLKMMQGHAIDQHLARAVARWFCFKGGGCVYDEITDKIDVQSFIANNLAKFADELLLHGQKHNAFQAQCFSWGGVTPPHPTVAAALNLALNLRSSKPLS